MIIRDNDGRLWFKSDDRIKEITSATEFRVVKAWFRKRYYLQAGYRVYSQVFECHYLDWEILGSYPHDMQAQLALNEIMGTKNSQATQC